METTAVETVAETIAATIPAETVAEVVETIAETVAETTPEVIEVVETIDYGPMLAQIYTALQDNQYLLGLLTSIALFFVVVCLCYFCYKFFRIFF